MEKLLKTVALCYVLFMYKCIRNAPFNLPATTFSISLSSIDDILMFCLTRKFIRRFYYIFFVGAKINSFTMQGQRGSLKKINNHQDF